jgi:hypothetical protein
MNRCKRNSAILIAAMLLMIFSGTQAYADPTFTDGGRQIGRGFADIFSATGSAFKKSGKAVGKGFKQAGKDTGRAFKQMGKDIGRAFSGKN